MPEVAGRLNEVWILAGTRNDGGYRCKGFGGR